MKRRSPILRLWTLVTVFALAFSQVAMAAFAPPAGIPAMAQAMAAEDGCHEADPATRHVCIKTCQDEPQKNEVASLAAMPPSLDAGLRVEAITPAIPAGRGDRDASLLARATAPPPHLLFARFLK